MNDSAPEIGSDRRERLREIIRTEVEKAGALADSRRSLELIVETSVRLAEDSCTVEVIDEQGRLQRGETIQDLLNRLRIKHPTLFKPPPPGSRTLYRGRSGRAGPHDQRRSRTGAGIAIRARAGLARGRLDATRWVRRGRCAGPVVGRTKPPSEPHSGGYRIGPGSMASGPSRGCNRRPMRAAGSFDDLQPVELPDRSPRFSIGPVLGAAAGVLALALLGYYATAGFPFDFGRAEPSQTAQAPAVEPDKTGAIAPANLAALEATGPLRGVPDVLDTATLWVEGKIVHLYGVEWVRGAGNPDEFTRYLRGRVVVCTPVASANAHRCILDGRDLSLVVLVNGGGRTTADAPTQFRAAEELAKSAKLGVWSK